MSVLDDILVGVREDLAREALRLASYKLPVATQLWSDPIVPSARSSHGNCPPAPRVLSNSPASSAD